MLVIVGTWIMIPCLQVSNHQLASIFWPHGTQNHSGTASLASSDWEIALKSHLPHKLTSFDLKSASLPQVDPVPISTHSSENSPSWLWLSLLRFATLALSWLGFRWSVLAIFLKLHWSRTDLDDQKDLMQYDVIKNLLDPAGLGMSQTGKKMQ